MEISATVDQIRSEEEQLRQRKQDAARDLRARAADLRTECESALAEAADLETQANEFDPPKPAPVPVPEVTLDAVQDDAEERPAVSRPKRARYRSRMPRAVKSGKPTEKTAMAALKDAGEPISIGMWAETLGCEKSALIPLVSTLMSAKAIKRTGEKRGTKYQAR
jgi:cell division septum initiation protein DivIVA